MTVWASSSLQGTTLIRFVSLSFCSKPGFFSTLLTSFFISQVAAPAHTLSASMMVMHLIHKYLMMCVFFSDFFDKKKVDPSKAGTLEASPKPEPPPPVQEEKKTSSKSAFMSLFKPKVSTNLSFLNIWKSLNVY